MSRDDPTPLEKSLLLHLLAHRGAQVRFEADQWTTEFGILRAFAQEGMIELKSTLRQLEMGRFVYRRVQYVIGYTEPKLVYSLTPSGHRLALDLNERPVGGGPGTPLGVASEGGAGDGGVRLPRPRPGGE